MAGKHPFHGCLRVLLPPFPPFPASSCPFSVLFPSLPTRPFPAILVRFPLFPCSLPSRLFHILPSLSRPFPFHISRYACQKALNKISVVVELAELSSPPLSLSLSLLFFSVSLFLSFSLVCFRSLSLSLSEKTRQYVALQVFSFEHVHCLLRAWSMHVGPWKAELSLDLGAVGGGHHDISSRAGGN